MNFTLWTLALAAVGALVWWIRRKWMRKLESTKVDRARKKSAAEQAELDRIACDDLGKSLMANVPSSRADAPGKPAAGSVHRSS